MQVTKFGHITQLTFLPYLLPVNCYLIEEERELTLIDAALPYCSAGILKEAGKIGKPITRIVLTHAHDDHVGSLDRLKKALPDVQVLISRRDSKLMNGDLSLEPGELDTPIRGGVPKKLKTRPDVLLEEGDAIGSLIAIYAPGHTPGSMAFLDKRTNTLLAGDAFHSKGKVTVAGKMTITFPFPALATWNKPTALASARKLRDIAPAYLACGHGSIVNQPANAIKQAIQDIEKDLGETKNAKKIG